MNDLYGSSEDLSRADKISRIKKSVRLENDMMKSAESPEIADWEQNINRILAKKERKPVSLGAETAESILAEIYGEDVIKHQASSVLKPEPAHEPVYEQAHETVHEPEIIHVPEKISEPDPHIIEAVESAPVPEIEVKKLPPLSHEREEIYSEDHGNTVREEEKNEVEKKTAKKIKDTPLTVSDTKKKKKKKKKKKTFRQRFLGLFPQKGDSVLEVIRKIVFMVSIIAIVVCGYMVADYYLDLWKSKKVNEETRNLYWTYETTEPSGGEKHPVVVTDTDKAEKLPVYTLLPGAKKLLDINKDVVGYIKIDGTPIDNVLLRGSDNFEYLDKKISGEENRAGELFLDWRNHFDDVDDEGHLKTPNSQNLVVYGHAMKDESMFGCLIKYRNTSDYYSDHPIIHLNSNYSHYTYKIFAIFILDSEDKSETKFDCWNKFNFGSEQEFYDFVNEAKRRTIRTNDVDVKYGDQLLTLSTCDDYLGERGRLIIMARQVRSGEDAKKGTENSKSNSNIKWPSMYYNTKTNEHYDPDDFVPYNAPVKKKESETPAEPEKVSVSAEASGAVG